MKVLLLHPGRTYPMDAQLPSIGLPIGLLSVAASLEKQHIPVSVLDCLLHRDTRITKRGGWISIGIEEEQLRACLRVEAPDIVGIGCPFTSQWDKAADAIRIVTNTLPEAIVVLGGPHAAICAKSILEQLSEVDFILAGEGELSMPQLISAIASDQSEALATVPGLLWRDDAGIVQSNAVEPIRALDELPFPAYHLIDFERLFAMQNLGLGARGMSRHTASIITSRGCPYTCTFCSIHLSMGRWWRAHSVDYVVRHIRLLVEHYGVRHLHIEDDNFTFRADRAQEICRKLIAAKLPLTWDTPNGIRADTLSEELIANMKASGCVGFDIAAESGDQEVLTKIVKKHLDLNVVERAAGLGQKAGLRVRCFFVIGFPGETKKNIERTIRFAQMLYRKYGCSPMLNFATPLPGTELARIVEENGFLVSEIASANLLVATSGTGKTKSMIRTPEFDPEYLRQSALRLNRRIRLMHMARLLTRPSKLVRAIQKKCLSTIRKLELMRHKQAI